MQLASSAAREMSNRAPGNCRRSRPAFSTTCRFAFLKRCAEQSVLAAFDLEKIAVEGVKIAEQLLAAKVGTRPDLLQAEIQLSVVRALLRDSPALRRGVARSLAAVVGVQGMPPAVLAGDLEGDMPALDWEASVQHLLANNPLLIANKAKSLQRNTS